MNILSLDPTLFSAGETSAAYLIWQYTLGFANIFLIIVLIVIVFSQLTGYGIDNYGIKRMLPRLIIAAIIINLSYIICQIAVDLSNLIGNGIVNIAKDVEVSVLDSLKANGAISATDITEFGFSALFTAIFGIATAGSVAMPIIIEGIMLGAAFWWIPLVFVALTGLIAVMIFFLMLAARKLLAVVLVAIAPLALICYILPNTKSLFDKWMSAFKAILIVYPVCGFLYAISKLMKVIAFSAGGIHIGMLIIALLSSFVPLLAAPLLLRKSLDSFGQLGGFISRVGDRMKGGVQNAHRIAQNSEMYKDAQRTATVNRARRNAQAFEAVRNGGGTRMQRFRYRLSGIDQTGRERAYARNQQMIERASGEDVETARIGMRESTGNYDTNIMGEQLNNYLNRIDSGESLTQSETNMMYALTSQLAQQSGGAKKISEALKNRTGQSAQLLGGYMASNIKVRQAAENKSQRTASRISDIASGAIDASTTQAQYDRMNNQYLEYRRQQVARGAPIDDEATWRAAQASAGNTIDATTVVQNIARNVLDKDKDFVTQSGSEVNELIQHISQDRIDRMAANSNLFSYGDVAEGVSNTVQSRASTEYVDPTGATVRIRNIQHDTAGNVTGYEMYDGTQWIGALGDLTGYITKAEQLRQQAAAPKVLGTRALKHNSSGNIIRVRDMSDGTVVDIDTGSQVDIRDYS